MKNRFDIRLWVKPALTVILGLVLLIRPGSLTASLARIVAAGIMLAGGWKMVSWVRGDRGLWKLLSGVILLLLGYDIWADPVNLERNLVRFVGILVLLQGLRGRDEIAFGHERMSSRLLLVTGALLMLMPLTVSHFVIRGIGAVVLLTGAVMTLDRLNDRSVW